MKYITELLENSIAGVAPIATNDAGTIRQPNYKDTEMESKLYGKCCQCSKKRLWNKLNSKCECGSYELVDLNK